MHIKSPFTDYYDFAAPLGMRDTQRVWIRTPSEIHATLPSRQHPFSPKFFPFCPSPHWKRILSFLNLYGYTTTVIRPAAYQTSVVAEFNQLRKVFNSPQAGLLFLAGNIYPYLHFTHTHADTTSDFYTWSSDQTKATLLEILGTHLKNPEKTVRIEPFNNLFDLKERDGSTLPTNLLYSDLLSKAPSPTPLFTFETFGSQAFIGHINPKLRDLQLQHHMDAQQVFQNIEMFLGSYSAYAETTLPQVSNEQRIEQAGFDLKSSFRHR